MSRHTIHAVAFPSGSNWVAQCLEYDIATQASSLDGLLDELERILAAQVFASTQEGRDPFADIPKAPRRFWEMYRQARTKIEPVRPTELPFPLDQRPRVEVRTVPVKARQLIPSLAGKQQEREETFRRIRQRWAQLPPVSPAEVTAWIEDGRLCGPEALLGVANDN